MDNLEKREVITPVVYWDSEWVTIENQYTYRMDENTKKLEPIPKEILKGEVNEEYFKGRYNGKLR